MVAGSTGIETYRFQGQEAHLRKCAGQLAGTLKLAVERHRRRGIDDDHDAHLLFVAELLHVGPIQSGEHIPIDEPQIVPRDVIAEIGELDARPPFAREMLAMRAVRESAARRDAHSLQTAEDRIIQQRCELFDVFRHLGFRVVPS